MMKIAMVISTPFPPEEGIGYYTYNLSKKLIERGNEVTVITRGSLRNIEHFHFDGIEVYKPRFLPLYPLHVHVHKLFVERFFRKLGKEFDVIHIHSPLPPKVEAIKNTVVTFHSPMLAATQHMEVIDVKSVGARVMGTTIAYRIERSLISSARLITTVSHAMAKEFLKYYEIGDKRIIITGNGVNIMKFSPNEKKHKKYLLYVGRLSYGKGLFDLLNAMYILKKNGDLRYPLYLVGKGGLKNKIEEYIHFKKLENDIYMLGYIPNEDLPKIYQGAIAFVFPSYYEGMPTVILEAMSSGLPVIATSIVAHSEIISHHKNGLLIPPHSPEMIAEAIRYVTESDTLRRRLGKNARKTIEKKFTWDKISRKCEMIYESVTN